MDKYTVLARIWHTGDERYYEAGESVTMTHLANFEVDALIAQGVIELIAKRKREVRKHGDTDSTEH